MTQASGVYWSAQWGGGRIAGTAADGTAYGNIPIDTPLPTCLGFGGRERNIVFVTSAKDGLSDAPDGAGDLYVFETNLRGWPQQRYKPLREVRV